MASECHYGRLNRGHTQTDACNQNPAEGQDVQWGLRGLLRLYWVRACFGCLAVPKVLELKSDKCTLYKCSYFTVECTLRTRWGGCGMSPTSTGRTLDRGDQRGTGGRVRARSMENPQRAEFSLLPPRNLGASQFFPILKISILPITKDTGDLLKEQIF